MPKQKNREVIIYQAKSGAIEFQGDFKHDTIWANQAQIIDLFGIDQSVVSRHIGNIFKDREVDKKSNMQKMHIAKSDKPVAFYSLDVILAVGYRTNSSIAISFRQWATKVLKQHLLDGYTINERRLKQNRDVKLKEMEKAVGLLQRVINAKQLNTTESQGLLKVITDYAQSWLLLQRYDEGKLALPKLTKKALAKLDYQDAQTAINQLALDLRGKQEAGSLFGQERGGSFQGIIGGLYQTFGGKELYSSLEEKAAHLLYFVIKDHPFSDGNKRIGSFLFILFLVKNNYLYNKKGERKINDNALVALALLIAESDPKEKDTIIVLITNLLVK
ncbi:MAG: virulence protein RhuM/Fic/DOC family protein [Candidatus Komeilibacteria bacterium]|nr:virulence protein RhuM/Fic/DOC family protein [Candidatus Komeilibacteria bacterium]